MVAKRVVTEGADQAVGADTLANTFSLKTVLQTQHSQHHTHKRWEPGEVLPSLAWNNMPSSNLVAKA